MNLKLSLDSNIYKLGFQDFYKFEYAQGFSIILLVICLVSFVLYIDRSLFKLILLYVYPRIQIEIYIFHPMKISFLLYVLYVDKFLCFDIFWLRHDRLSEHEWKYLEPIHVSSRQTFREPGGPTVMERSGHLIKD